MKEKKRKELTLKINDQALPLIGGYIPFYLKLLTDFKSNADEKLPEIELCEDLINTLIEDPASLLRAPLAARLIKEEGSDSVREFFKIGINQNYKSTDLIYNYFINESIKQGIEQGINEKIINSLLSKFTKLNRKLDPKSTDLIAAHKEQLQNIIKEHVQINKFDDTEMTPLDKLVKYYELTKDNVKNIEDHISNPSNKLYKECPKLIQTMLKNGGLTANLIKDALANAPESISREQILNRPLIYIKKQANSVDEAVKFIKEYYASISERILDLSLHEKDKDILENYQAQIKNLMFIPKQDKVIDNYEQKDGITEVLNRIIEIDKLAKSQGILINSANAKTNLLNEEASLFRGVIEEYCKENDRNNISYLQNAIENNVHLEAVTPFLFGKMAIRDKAQLDSVIKTIDQLNNNYPDIDQRENIKLIKNKLQNIIIDKEDIKLDLETAKGICKKIHILNNKSSTDKYTVEVSKWIEIVQKKAAPEHATILLNEAIDKKYPVALIKSLVEVENVKIEQDNIKKLIDRFISINKSGDKPEELEVLKEVLTKLPLDKYSKMIDGRKNKPESEHWEDILANKSADKIEVIPEKSIFSFLIGKESTKQEDRSRSNSTPVPAQNKLIKLDPFIQDDLSIYWTVKKLTQMEQQTPAFVKQFKERLAIVENDLLNKIKHGSNKLEPKEEINDGNRTYKFDQLKKVEVKVDINEVSRDITNITITGITKRFIVEVARKKSHESDELDEKNKDRLIYNKVGDKVMLIEIIEAKGGISRIDKIKAGMESNELTEYKEQAIKSVTSRSSEGPALKQPNYPSWLPGLFGSRKGRSSSSLSRDGG